jgi:hypothetical protein
MSKVSNSLSLYSFLLLISLTTIQKQQSKLGRDYYQHPNWSICGTFNRHTEWMRVVILKTSGFINRPKIILIHFNVIVKNIANAMLATLHF